MGAALDWWRDAGVDCAFVDDPQDWLAASRPVVPPTPAQRKAMAEAEVVAAIPPIGADRAGWPSELAGFAAWWMAEPSLAPAGARRVPPAGPAEAELMVLVAMPEEEDSERLLSGRGGKMLDAMLAAMDLSRDRTYLTSVLPARIAVPDWADLASRRLGDVLAHHVALAQPRRLLVFGRSLVSTLLDNDSTHKRSDLRAFNHDGGSVPAISTYDLEALLAKPAFKASLWNRWLEWTGTEQA
ncbi:uracil-DNA glycosylase family protein [Novosphingobium sp. KCTC 2891]|uniref:uracil-DNA glycosylase family protein n=1 Tax=Novosphingobium sp. KCTC 2891 TaxID=2989730 RepID=UPI002222F0BD|nr:uracil-DNA glycosylase family protein [Novosphingobium sp. KCTC 2891]